METPLPTPMRLNELEREVNKLIDRYGPTFPIVILTEHDDHDVLAVMEIGVETVFTEDDYRQVAIIRAKRADEGGE